MVCEICKTELNCHDIDSNNKFYYCNNFCTKHSYHIDLKICNHNLITVNHVNGDTKTIRNQCSLCGELIGRSFSKLKFKTDLNSEPLYSDFIRYRDSTNSKFKTLIDRYQLKFDNLKNEKSADFWLKYPVYLKSKTWDDKRRLVLKRDNYICQSCLENTATIVHHITYEHVFNEPLFELVSVCSNCHDNIHDKWVYKK